MIGCLRTCVRKQPTIALYFESENELKFYNLKARLHSPSVKCLATDACLTADPGVPRLIMARSDTYIEIDHEIISTVIFLPSANHSRRIVVSYKQKFAHEVLVNCLFKLAQKKEWLGELTVLPRP